MSGILESLKTFLQGTGIAQLLGQDDWYLTLIMYGIVAVLVYLAVVKQFEPLLLLPIAVGMLLTNIPGAFIYHADWFLELKPDYGYIIANGGFLDLLYLGVKLGIYPCIIFIGIGAMTDFTPLIANPKSLLIGAGAQLGVFVAFAGALLLGFTPEEAASIGIIGGADGPTAITVTKQLAAHLLPAIAIAAYSYMALIPMIQPPFMKLFTTKKERLIRMTALREVSFVEKLVFPVLVTLVVGLIVPDALVLIGSTFAV